MKARTFAPEKVMGGWRIARFWWVLEDAGRPEEGWDQRSTFDGMDETVYPTLEECEAAVIAQYGDQQ